MKQKIKTKGHVQLRRGIVEHASKMTCSEFKLYIIFLTQANYWEESSDKRCFLTNAQLAEICDWSIRQTKRLIKRLISKGYLVKISPKKVGVIVLKFDVAKGGQNVTPFKKQGGSKCHPRKSQRGVKMSPFDQSGGVKMSPLSSTTPTSTKVGRSPKKSFQEVNSKHKNEKPTTTTPPPKSDVDSQSDDQKQTITRSEGARQVLDALDESKRKRKKEEADHAEDVSEL